MPRGAIARGPAFLAVWVILADVDMADLPGAVVAVAAATWASLRLVPPAPGSFSLAAMLRLALRFPGQSLVAGGEIAWRALLPRLPLSPGMVAYAPLLSPGPARDAFCAYASLVPGTLPAGEDGPILHVHSLDTGQPVAANMAREEALFARAIGHGRGGQDLG